MTTATDQHPGYRREIDGLRAFAILPVLFFHFSVPGFSGGFVGVDVFFVISGFLIGGLLWGELSQHGTIRLGRFFLRRVRRLAPAYFVMALASLALAWAILLPFEFREFGKELIASTVYLSNVHFFREAGYFDTAAEQKVLLHTWSLAVEEQFYIFLPFLLLALRRARRWLWEILLVLAALSLLACIVITPLSQPAAFYLFPMRAWELLAGVCLAIWGQRRGFGWAVHPALSWLGLGLILVSVVAIPKGEAFPGVLAIAPVLGAVLVILNGRQVNAVNRLLRHRVPVFFGLISYSLYLWHWPVMVLSHYHADGDPGAVARAGLMALSVALAWVSMRFIETPVRRGGLRAPALLGAAALASVATLGSGAAIYLQDGMIDRFPPAIRTHIAASADFNQDWRRCRVPATGAFAGIELCPIGPEGEPRVLVWGDSHVRAFKEGLEAAAFEADVPALIIWRAGCPPLFGIAKEENSATRLQNEACAAANAQIAGALDSLPSLRSLLLIGRWSYYAEGQGIGRDIDNTIRLMPAPGSPLSAPDQAGLFAAAFAHSIDRLAGRFADIFILQQVPEVAGYNSREVSRQLAHGHLSDPDEIAARLSIPQAAAMARAARAEAAIAAVTARPGVHPVDSWAPFCDGQTCSAMIAGEAGYFDGNHVTNRTSRQLRGLFAPVFASAPEGS